MFRCHQLERWIQGQLQGRPNVYAQLLGGSSSYVCTHTYPLTDLHPVQLEPSGAKCSACIICPGHMMHTGICWAYFSASPPAGHGGMKQQLSSLSWAVGTGIMYFPPTRNTCFHTITSQMLSSQNKPAGY